MSMPHVEDNGLVIVRYNKPSLDLAVIAQHVGFMAWRDALERSDDEVLHVFDPDNFVKAAELYMAMKRKVGRFVGVLAVLDGEKIGYAWGADDVGNMSRGKQRIKRVTGRLKGKKPYAWDAQINVLPQHQGNGIGTILLRELFEPFKKSQKASAYVFNENKAALRWFANRGFSPRPDSPVDPNPVPYGPDMYFGQFAEHVQQWRLEAESTEVVIKNTFHYPDFLAYKVTDGTARE